MLCPSTGAFHRLHRTQCLIVNPSSLDPVRLPSSIKCFPASRYWTREKMFWEYDRTRWGAKYDWSHLDTSFSLMAWGSSWITVVSHKQRGQPSVCLHLFLANICPLHKLPAQHGSITLRAIFWKRGNYYDPGLLAAKQQVTHKVRKASSLTH